MTANGFDHVHGVAPHVPLLGGRKRVNRGLMPEPQDGLGLPLERLEVGIGGGRVLPRVELKAHVNVAERQAFEEPGKVLALLFRQFSEDPKVDERHRVVVANEHVARMRVTLKKTEHEQLAQYRKCDAPAHDLDVKVRQHRGDEDRAGRHRAGRRSSRGWSRR